jgi:hypothetical protein
LSEGQQNPLCARKSLVSYFWITTFSVFAAQYAANNLKIIIDNYGIRTGLTYMAVPFVFFLTLIRFSIGNILHIRSLENKGYSPYVWLGDFVVIFLESTVFLLLGIYTWGNDLRFLKLLAILCFIDAFWVLAMVTEYFLKKRPEPIPWAWGLLNIAGGLYLVATVYANLPMPFTSTASYGIFVAWFLISCFIDVILIDHYKLLHKLDSDVETVQKPQPRQTKLGNQQKV